MTKSSFSEILTQIKTPEFVEFMREKELGTPVSQNSPNYFLDVMNRADFAATVPAALLAMALSDLLENTPQLETIQPVWKPVCESNSGEMCVVFQCWIKFQGIGSEFNFRYEQDISKWPEECQDIMLQDRLGNLVDVAETVTPQTWNAFSFIGMDKVYFGKLALAHFLDENPEVSDMITEIKVWADKYILTTKTEDTKAKKDISPLRRQM